MNLNMPDWAAWLGEDLAYQAEYVTAQAGDVSRLTALLREACDRG